MVDRRTYTPKISELRREWFIVDAEGQTLGRLASQIASVLRGKTKPTYAPHMDTGDFVIVINAEKIKVTGAKETEKFYYRHSGYPGGLKAVPSAICVSGFPIASFAMLSKACCRATPSGKRN